MVPMKIILWLCGRVEVKNVGPYLFCSTQFPYFPRLTFGRSRTVVTVTKFALMVDLAHGSQLFFVF